MLGYGDYGDVYGEYGFHADSVSVHEEHDDGILDWYSFILFLFQMRFSFHYRVFEYVVTIYCSGRLIFVRYFKWF